MGSDTNIPDTALERALAIGGSGLAIAGLLNRSPVKGIGLMLLGGALVLKGIQTRHETYEQAHGCVKPKTPETHGFVIEREIIVSRPAAQVYAYWRNVENLPKFMAHIDSVVDHGEGKSSWTAKTSTGGTLTWDAEIIADVPFETIAWRSLPGAVIRNEGAVYFHPLSGDRTEVRLYLELHLPLGGLGVKAAQLTGDDPEAEVDADLKAFKAQVEAEGLRVPEASRAGPS